MGEVLPFRRHSGAPEPGFEEMGDDGLLAACSVGEVGAFATLFDRFHPAVHRFLFRLTGGGPDLDDLVQTTFLEVWRSARTFRGDSAARSWVLGIAANLARRRVRSDTRRRLALAALEAGGGPTPLRPDDHAESRQRIARLEEALSELSPPLRTAFVLCDLEHVSGVEAARVLGVRPGTLWRRLHDARKALRRALEEGTP